MSLQDESRCTAADELEEVFMAGLLHGADSAPCSCGQAERRRVRPFWWCSKHGVPAGQQSACKKLAFQLQALRGTPVLVL